MNKNTQISNIKINSSKCNFKLNSDNAFQLFFLNLIKKPK